MANTGVKRGVGLQNPFPNIPGSTGGILLKDPTKEGGIKWSNPSGADVTANALGLLVLSGTANVESIIRANTLNQMGAPTAAVNMNSQNLTSVALATVAGMGATFEQLPGVSTFTSSGTFTPTVSGLYLTIVIAGGGGGGGAGSAATNATNQSGAGGGGSGECRSAFQSLVAATGYTVTVGAAGTGGAGGAAGGNNGVVGVQGGTSTFAGPTNVLAAGGGGGAQGAATSTSPCNGGLYGIGGTNGTPIPGCGGTSNVVFNTSIGGGASIGFSAPGGGSGGQASSTKGGGAGSPGSFAAAGGGAAGGNNTSGTLAGVSGTPAAAIDYGAGGGGGGGGAGSTGAGGTGGAGGKGVVFVLGPLI